MNRPIAVAFLALAALLPLEPARGQGTVTIDTVVPSTGPVAGGTIVTITGSGFVAPMTVSFGGVAATTVVVDSPTQIRATTAPKARGAVDVLVTQTTAPPTSATAVGAFTYLDPAARLWIPRAPGSATGGNPGAFDVCVVDAANRVVETSLDLNASDPLLLDDDDWAVTQVVFDKAGAWAYLATAGRPGTLDSRRVFVVKTAPSPALVTSIDTTGNPYQVALSEDGKTLFVADGGSWATSSLTNLPSGVIRAYDVTDPSAPVAKATAPAGVLPVLSYDTAAYGRWGTNSAFTAKVQRGPGDACGVMNTASNTVFTIDVSDPTDLGATAPVSLPSAEGDLAHVGMSIASPFSNGYVLIQSTGVPSTATNYALHRLSADEVLDKGTVATPVVFYPRFLSGTPTSPVFRVPCFSSVAAWPHPDGQSLVALPAAEAAVVVFSTGNGSTASRRAVGGTGAPTSLAFNDVTGLFYARHDTGGWTVLSVAATRNAAPVVVATIADATGVDSLRVFGGGAEMAGTSASSLAILDAVAASANAHKVIATVPLTLNPAGGPVHPQPAGGTAVARAPFVIPPEEEVGPTISAPLADTRYCPGDDPPLIEFEEPEDAVAGGFFELELGSQPDFIVGPGAARASQRVPRDAVEVVPILGRWLRVLRAAAGEGDRRVYVRVNLVERGGFRRHGKVENLLVCGGEPPVALPVDTGPVTPDEVPGVFPFEPEGPGRYWIEFAGADGFEAGVLARHRVVADFTLAQVGAVVPPDTWRRAAIRAAIQGDSVLWRVRFRDRIGRDLLSDEQSLEFAE